MIRYINHPSFADISQRADMLSPMPRLEQYEQLRREQRLTLADVPSSMMPLFSAPLLDFEQSTHLFRRMNLLKHLAVEAGETSPAARRLLAEAKDVRDRLVLANTRLVPALLKRFKLDRKNRVLQEELCTECYATLIKAVDSFDFARGWRFSTYATTAMYRRAAEHLGQEDLHRNRFVSNVDDASFQSGRIDRERPSEGEASLRVDRMLEHLPAREQYILRQRFGLNRNGEPVLLEALGKELKLSKERVRQLEKKALAALRASGAPVPA